MGAPPAFAFSMSLCAAESGPAYTDVPLRKRISLALLQPTQVHYLLSLVIVINFLLWILGVALSYRIDYDVSKLTQIVKTWLLLRLTSSAEQSIHFSFNQLCKFSYNLIFITYLKTAYRNE